jgi:predicted N-acetyltransferase YhbS
LKNRSGVTLLARGNGAGLWHLSGVAARRFTDQPYMRYVLPVPGRRLFVRLMTVTALGWDGWRANDVGTAVCGVKGAPGPRRRLLALSVWLLSAAIALIGWMIWMGMWVSVGLGVVPALSFLGLGGLAVAMGWRAARVGRAKARLSHWPDPLTPGPAGAKRPVGGRIVEVQIVASEDPGAGRALLRKVVNEADQHGWALTLDAANDRLATYYGDLGFVPLGDPALMPFGERVTRMVRLPLGAGAATGDSAQMVKV